MILAVRDRVPNRNFRGRGMDGVPVALVSVPVPLTRLRVRQNDWAIPVTAGCPRLFLRGPRSRWIKSDSKSLRADGRQSVTNLQPPQGGLPSGVGDGEGLHQSARRINERDSVSIQIDANHSARHDNPRADRAGWQLSLRCTNGRSGRVIVRNFGSPPRQQVSFSDVRLSSSRSSWRIA